MSNAHVCNLPPKETTGFAKLPPNASRFRKLARSLRKQLAINPNNFKCREFFQNKSSLAAEQRRYAKSPHVFVVHPFSNLNSFIEVSFFFTWMLCLITDPLEIISGLGTKDTPYHTFDIYIVTNLQRLLVVAFFFVGYVDRKTKEIVTEPKKVFWHYLTTYFIFDATATGLTLNLFGVIFFRDMNLKEEYIFENIGKVIRICCFLLRTDTLLHYLKHITQHLNLHTGIQSSAVYILKTFIFIHTFACFVYGVPDALYTDDWPKESWFYQAGVHRQSNTTSFSRYLECLLVIVCYFFGASHGIYEVTMPNEQLFLSIVTFFGRLYTLFLLADILKNFGIAGVSESKYEQQLIALKEYMVSKNLPDNLRKRLLKFYECKLQKHYFNEPEILSTLSEHLRTQLFLFSARKLVQEAYILKCLPRVTLGAVVASMKMDTYSPKDVIIKIGSVVDNVFFISTGTVTVINEQGLELIHLEDGDEFGIIYVFTGFKQIYQIEAVESTEVFYIKRDVLLHILHGHPEAFKKFRKSVEERANKLKEIEKSLKRGESGFLSHLRSGKILETVRLRPIVAK